MPYIFLFVLTSTLFIQALRFGQRNGANIFSAVAVNYIIAAVVSIVYWQLNRTVASDGIPWSAMVTGIIAGVVIFSHVPFILGSYRLAGVGITSTVVRAGVIIPVLIAWYAWNEPMTTLRWIALAMVPLAMFLLRKPDRTSRHLTLKSDVLLIGSLLVGAALFTLHKFAQFHFDKAGQEIYKVCLFSTASVISVVYVLLKRITFTARDIRIGAVIGLANTGSMIFVQTCEV